MRNWAAEEKALILAAAGRLVASPMFAAAERQSRFLQYVVDKTLAGEPVKETLIGHEVYGRPVDYEPRTDAIVRVEAVRLRSKLRGYYAGPGKDDAIQIQMPKGSYAAAFQIAERNEAPPPEPARPRFPRRSLWIAATACFVLMGMAAGVRALIHVSPAESILSESALPPYLEAHRLMRLHPAGETEEQGRTRLAKAAGLFREAAQRQPRSARILASLAQAYLGVSSYEEAADAARNAIAADQSLAEAHEALGEALFFGQFALRQSLEAFDRAVQLNPSQTSPYRLRNDLLCIQGRFVDALAALSQVQAANPTDHWITAHKAIAYFHWRRYDDAAKEVSRALALKPEFVYGRWILGMTRFRQGRIAEAESLFRQTAVHSTRGAFALVHLLAATGRREEALRVLERAEGNKAEPYARALLAAATGDNDDAVRQLAQALEQHDLNIPYAALDARFDSLRTDRRFTAILRKLDLPDPQALK